MLDRHSHAASPREDVAYETCLELDRWRGRSVRFVALKGHSALSAQCLLWVMKPQNSK